MSFYCFVSQVPLGILLKSSSPEKHSISLQETELKKPLVGIIIAYFNGARFFEEQLKSLTCQTYPNIYIILSDDNSDEGEGDLGRLLKNSGLNYTLKCRKKTIGYPQNFINSLQNAPDNCEYFAFCDQDDIWFPDKIERAVSTLDGVDKDIPSLYCTRTELVDSDGKSKLGLSAIPRRPPSFKNALTQNIAGGNTMVFNKKAAELLIKASLNRQIVTHDWWTYLIVSGAGGYIHYDAEPSLKYRQHDKNAIGSNNGIPARLKRINLLLQGKFRQWCDLNVANLIQNRDILTPSSRKILHNFEHARNASLIFRIYGFWKCKVYRQTRLGNLALFIAILLKKV